LLDFWKYFFYLHKEERNVHSGLPKTMARIITITGGKGGVGKTNISLNLALCLAKLGSKVCLFDADLGLANINILLGLYPDYTLEDAIFSNKNIDDIIITIPQGIDIIPGSSGVEKLANLDSQELQRIIQQFAAINTYDFYLFDTSSGISRDVLSFCLASSEVMLVITPEPTSITDAYALLKVLCLNNFSGSVRVVVNLCKNTKIASVTYNKFKDVIQKYLTIDIEPLGIVVHDDKVPESVRRQQPLTTLFPESGASKCFHIMASRLVANRSESFEIQNVESFWSRFVRFVKTPLTFPNERGTGTKEPPAENVPAAPEKTEEQTTSTEQQASGAPESRADVPEKTEADSPPDEQPPPSAPESGADVPEKTEADSPPAEQPPPSAPENRKKISLVFNSIRYSKGLPTLPHILLKVIEACDREDMSIKELGEIIAKDPSLSTKILRMVNSAFYNLPQKVNQFEQALSLLGIDTIKNLALCTSVYQVFDHKNVDRLCNLKLFWWHSLTCAVLADLLAKKTGSVSAEDAFLCGLLHDIGKLMLWENFPKEYSELFTSSKSKTNFFIEEHQMLGITHAEAGAWLIENWQLQSFLIDAVLYHHEPPERIKNALPMVKIIYTANCLCSNSLEHKDQRFKIAQDILGLEAGEFEAIMQQAEVKVSHVAQSLGIEIETPDSERITPEDEQVQARLTSQIRDISLLQGTLQNLLNAHDTAAILQVAYQGLEILFDMKSILFFLYDQQENVLAGREVYNDSTDSVINELTIPLQDGKSLLVTSLTQAITVNSLTGNPSGFTIIDEQIIRLMGRQGIICFPLTAREQYVGVLVLGIDENQISLIDDTSNLLTLFVNQVALTLHAEHMRRSQAQRIISERLAASTAIARRVAHEVNNPLGIIKNYLKILELNLTDNNMPSDEIKIINDEIDRVSLIIDELSDFSRPRTYTHEPVDINNLLKDITLLSRDSLAHDNISLQLEPAEELPPINTAKNGLKQVVINLIKNAAEAIQKDGTITVAARNVIRSPSESPGNEAESITIMVADDGPGLPDSVRERLFEPFVSTKGENHAGLGLSIVYKIIKDIKGSITCETEQGKGTCFTITLPRSMET